MELGAQPSKLNISKCHFQLTRLTYYLCLLNDCLGPNLQVYQTFHICICAPRAHDKSKVGGTCPSVPHGVGAYVRHSESREDGMS